VKLLRKSDDCYFVSCAYMTDEGMEAVQVIPLRITLSFSP